MKVEVKIGQEHRYADLNHPIDISLTTAQNESPLAWYVDPLSVSPVMTERFTGSVQQGGDVNFRNLSFNPHGNCTHTECVGHIAKEVYSVNNLLEKHHFIAQVITVIPNQLDSDNSMFEKKGDFIMDAHHFNGLINSDIEALIIRTLPNSTNKKSKNYNSTNWPYLKAQAAKYIREQGVKHLLIDQPSIDREEDGGQLLSHRAFWNYDNEIDLTRTITELIYVPENVKDGIYLLNLSVSNIENDACPSRPVLFSLNK